MPLRSSCEITRINKQETKLHMKKLGTSLIALGVAGAIFATASASANDKATSVRQQTSRVALVAQSRPQAKTPISENKEVYDFGGAESFENEHPEGGG
jgi:hypothetical protein